MPLRDLLRGLGDLLLGYAPPRNRRVTKPLLPEVASPSYDPAVVAFPAPLRDRTMHHRPLAELIHIRRDLAKVTASLKRAIRRKDFNQMTLDLSALNTLQGRIDAVSEALANVSGGDTAAAFAAAISQTNAANQAQVDSFASGLTTSVTALEGAVSTLSSAPSTGVSSSLSSGVSTSLSNVSSALSGVSTSLSSTPSNGGGLPSGSPLAIIPVGLPPGVPGQSYTGKVNTTGGTAPISLEVLTGALPTGLTMALDGTVSGTVDVAAVTESFTVQATDAAGSVITAAMSIQITPAN